MILLEDLKFDLPPNTEELRLVSRAFKVEEEVTPPKGEDIPEEKRSIWIRVANAVILAVLVFFLLTLPPSEDLFKRVGKGPLRTATRLVVFAVVYWLLATLLLR